MTKKEVYKLKPGTWLEIGWSDSPPCAALLLMRPEQGRGDVSLCLWYPSQGASDPYMDHHAVHTQIRAVLGTVTVPQLAFP